MAARPCCARPASMMRLTMIMPARMSCLSKSSNNRLDSSRARTVGMDTTAKHVRSLSANRSCNSIILNWNDRNWSGPSPPASQPKRSRNRATRSARRSRKSGKERRRNACPVGAVSMIMWSNLSFLNSSNTSTKATISSLPGGSVSKRLTKSSMGNCCNTCPTMPPCSSRRCNASRTVAWNRDMAAAVSTSMAHNSPTAVGASNRVASSVRPTPRASPSECAGSVDTMRTRFPSPAMRAARAALIDVLPTPPLPPKSITWVSGATASGAPGSPYTTEAKYVSAGTPTSDSGRSATSSTGSPRPAPIRRISSSTDDCASTRLCQYASPAPSSITWFTTMRRQQIPSRLSSWISRPASAQSSAVGRVTTTNSVEVAPGAEPGGVLNARPSHATRSRILRILASASSNALSTSPVSMPPKPTMLSTPPRLRRMLRMRSMNEPRNSGTSSMRRVWPVGAVSKTTTS
mmetsp:Transcript_37919/g.114554  ORF Transcript_37919/g.114554 Transcript_37919/m.114554 type:complete len:462 (-) Transcript_37919:447-1832(-)